MRKDRQTEKNKERRHQQMKERTSLEIPWRLAR